MKSLTFTLLFALLTAAAVAQVPAIQWQKSLGGSALDVGSYVIQNPDSTYVTIGTSASNNFDVSGNHGGYDAWVVKLSTTGSVVWQISIGGSNSDHGNFIQRTADGGYIVAGDTRSNDGDVSGNHGNVDCMIVKLTSTGSIVWLKLLGGSALDLAHCIRQTSDGGYIVVGSSASNDGDVTGNHGSDDYWVAKLTSAGAITWQQSYGGSGHDDASAVWEAPDGTFFVAGNSFSSDGDVTGAHGDFDYWILKLSATGSIIWQKALGGTGDESVCEHSTSGGMQGTPDSGVIVTGWSNSNDGDVTGNHGSYDYWVVKLTSTGSIAWQKSFGGTDDDESTCLSQTSDSGYVIGGTTYSNNGDVSGNNSGYDYWVIKMSAGGTLQWQKCMGGSGAPPGDCANGVQQTLDGGFIVTGFSNANDSDVSGNHGDYDFWLVKLRHLPTLGVPGTVTNDAVSVFPNPTTGTIYVAGADNTCIQVYNALGQLLITATNTNQVDALALPAGMYLVRVCDAQGALIKQERIIKE